MSVLSIVEKRRWAGFVKMAQKQYGKLVQSDENEQKKYKKAKKVYKKCINLGGHVLLFVTMLVLRGV